MTGPTGQGCTDPTQSHDCRQAADGYRGWWSGRMHGRSRPSPTSPMSWPASRGRGGRRPRLFPYPRPLTSANIPSRRLLRAWPPSVARPKTLPTPQRPPGLCTKSGLGRQLFRHPLFERPEGRGCDGIGLGCIGVQPQEVEEVWPLRAGRIPRPQTSGNRMRGPTRQDPFISPSPRPSCRPAEHPRR